MKKGRIRQLFDNKVFALVFSIVVAIISWAVIVLSIDPNTTRTIDNVPVTISSTNNSYKSLGLDIIDKEEVLVRVTVEGPRSVVGMLERDSILVTPNFSGVNGAGTYDVPLVATKNNQLLSYTITSVNPNFVPLRFDVAISKKVPVTAKIEGLTVGNDYIVEQTIISPSEVTVTGPEQDVDKVAAIVVTVPIDAELAETMKTTAELVAVDKDGNVLSGETLKIDPVQADITIPIYKRGVLPLDIEFTNVPDGFDLSTLDYTLTFDEINIAASETVVGNLRTKIIGYVDLATFKLGESYTFDIELPSGYVNLDNVTSVTATFAGEDIDSKKVVVTDLRVINAPANYKVTVMNEMISDVTVIGKTEDVQTLLAGSVVAIVDMSELGGIESGTFNVPVKFKISSNNTTWVAGSYTAVIEVEPL